MKELLSGDYSSIIFALLFFVLSTLLSATKNKSYCIYGSSYSSQLLVTYGVPQGALLSPLLFCIYSNDLPTVAPTCNLESFVDDSKLLLSFPIEHTINALRKVEEDLVEVAKWCCDNKLLINPPKIKFLIIGTRQLRRNTENEISISFLGKDLSSTQSGNDLGVILDSVLSYDEHITKLVSTCMSKLCQIYRVKDCFTKDTLKIIIESLVLNKLFYCSSV